MSGNKKVAVVQMVSTEDPLGNLERAENLIKRSVDAGARLVVLPENFLVFSGARMAEVASDELKDSCYSRRLAELARENRVWLLAGSVPLVVRPDGSRIADGRVRTCSLLFNAEGELVARYDKRHLFDVDVADAHGNYRESSVIEPGDDLIVVDTPVGRLGLTICYDLRFPEFFQRLRQAGAELVTVPAAFTFETGRAHWEILLRARAIENQCYLLGSNQGGQHSATRTTWGHSMIVDPYGSVLDQHDSGEGVVVAEIDLEALQAIRRRMPVMEHRRD